MEPRERALFFEVHRDLPREAPGHRDCTIKALQHVLDAVGAAPRVVLDVGCGPGQQTLDLAEALPEARLVAADLHEPFLRDLGRRSGHPGVDARVTPVGADMKRLPVAEGSLDLIWCEGAAYIMGVTEALAAWRPLLHAGGACAFTEAVWLRADPPDAARRFWAAYPGMGDMEACRAIVRAGGYQLVHDFVLPTTAWWDDYYGPMSERLDVLDDQYRDDAAAMTVLAGCRHEIDIYRRYGDWYGYAFFVARKPGGD